MESSDPESQFTHPAYLSNERLEPTPNLPGTQITRSSDEFNPKGHGAFPSITQFQDCSSRDGSVVHKVEDSHLIQVQDDFKLGRRMNLDSFKVRTVSGSRRRVRRTVCCLIQTGNESWFLKFNFFQNVLNHFHYFSNWSLNRSSSKVDALRTKFVDMERKELWSTRVGGRVLVRTRWWNQHDWFDSSWL